MPDLHFKPRPGDTADARMLKIAQSVSIFIEAVRPLQGVDASKVDWTVLCYHTLFPRHARPVTSGSALSTNSAKSTRIYLQQSRTYRCPYVVS